MPTITDQAVVIRSWDFSETSQTVSLFCREHGIIRGLAKGSKREKGNFSGGLDVLTRGEVVAILKPTRDLATITAWHLQDMFPALRQRLAANRAGQYMADLVHHMLREHDPHPMLFDAMSHSLAMLGDTNAVEQTLLGFQWKLLGETGYQPELDRDARSGKSLPGSPSALAFSPSAGGVVVDGEQGTSPAVQWRVRRGTIDALRALSNGELPPSADAESIRRANRLLAAYFREIIGVEPPTMRWAFSDLDV